MKVILENAFTYHNKDSHTDVMFGIFNEMVRVINECKDFDTLKIYMEEFMESSINQRYFNYGFGANHMWVKQRSLNSPTLTEVRIDPTIRHILVENR